jgi:hypothetical protein
MVREAVSSYNFGLVGQVKFNKPSAFLEWQRCKDTTSPKRQAWIARSKQQIQSRCE